MKLTNSIRSKILEGFCENKFAAIIEKEIKNHQEYIKACVAARYSTDLIATCEKVTQYVCWEKKVKINKFYNERCSAQKKCEEIFFIFDPNEIELLNKYPEKNYIYFGTNDEEEKYLRDFFNAFISKLDDFIEQKNTISSVLYSCNTDRQLTETLPEIMHYYPAITTELLPISLETLNKAKTLLS